MGHVHLDPLDVSRLVMSGEVDVHAVDDFSRAHGGGRFGSPTTGLRAVLREVDEVDMHGVTFLDSTAVSLLVGAARAVPSRRLRLSGLCGHPASALELMGIAALFDRSDVG